MLQMLPLRPEGEALRRKEDEVIDNIIREIFGPDITLEYIDKDAVSRSRLTCCTSSLPPSTPFPPLASSSSSIFFFLPQCFFSFFIGGFLVFLS